MNDWEDTRTKSRFLYKPNWIKMPRRGFSFHRDKEEYAGTTSLYINLGKDLENQINYGFTNVSKQDEHDIVEFFCQREGRLERFWLPFWKNFFTLRSDIDIYDSAIDIEFLNFKNTFNGYEFFFMELTDGSYISRKIDAVQQVGQDYEKLILSTIMQRSITASDIRFFSFFYLMRFQVDEIKISHITSDYSEIELKFTELVKEYGDEVSEES